MNKETMIALEADPNDPEDFDVSVAALERALAERRERRALRGRPPGSVTSDRQQVTLRLPRAVIEHFKADGPGWQTRAIAVLEREVARPVEG